MLHLYFIRHGQSENNALWDQVDRDTYLTTRKPDPDLSEMGKQQVHLMADFVTAPYNPEDFDPQNRSGFGLTHLYSSLMIRAVKTGLAISKKLDIPLVAWPDMHETGGMFEIQGHGEEKVYLGKPGHGRTYYETHFPSLVLPEDLTDAGWWNQDKEPREEYIQRAQRIFEGLCEAHAGKDHRVGIITHGGIFARILTVMFHVERENYWFLMNNCGISRIDVDEEGHVMLVYMNRVDFLPDDLVT